MQEIVTFFWSNSILCIIANGGGKKRWGVRAASVSTVTKIDARQNARSTT